MSTDQEIRAACVTLGALLTVNGAALNVRYAQVSMLAGHSLPQQMARRLHSIVVRHSWPALYYAAIGANTVTIITPGHRGGYPDRAANDPAYHITVQFSRAYATPGGLVVHEAVGGRVHIHPTLHITPTSKTLVNQFGLVP